VKNAGCRNDRRRAQIGRGSSDATCPIVALQTWLKLARIGHGPLFRRVTGRGKEVGPDRLLDQEVARLLRRAALAAGMRADLLEGERIGKFAGHSLRAGLASSAEVDERYVQKHLGHASAEMTLPAPARAVSRQPHQSRGPLIRMSRLGRHLPQCNPRVGSSAARI
jgi:integrase